MSASPAADSRDHGSLIFNLFGLLLLAVTIALGAAYLLDYHVRGAVEAPAERASITVSRTIAGRELDIPVAFFRNGGQAGDAFASQVDLRLSLDLAGVDRPVDVDVTLLPRNRVRASAVMLDTVYLHQFGQPTDYGPPGLVGKPLMDDDGQSLAETVWYDPLSAAPFVAKCLAAIEPEAPARCIRTVVLTNGLGAVYAFDESALMGWKDFDPQMLRIMESLGAF